MRKLLIVSVLLIFTGCGKSGSNPGPGGGGTTTTTTPPSPIASLLSAPAQNAVCTTGAVISTTQTSIIFTWNASANADNYDLNIKNLLTGTVTTQNTSAITATVTLLRNTPYSWYIVSKSTKTSSTAQSDTWKFYVAGLGSVSYAPFPAAITAPTYGQSVTATNGKINLTWTGSSVDNDIIGYDIYFGTTNTPAVFKSGVTDMFLNGIAVSSGTTYYWKVITKDAKGNTSDSGIYQFSIL